MPDVPASTPEPAPDPVPEPDDPAAWDATPLDPPTRTPPRRSAAPPARAERPPPPLTRAERGRTVVPYLVCWAVLYLIAVILIAQIPECTPPDRISDYDSPWACDPDRPNLGEAALGAFTLYVLPWAAPLGWLLTAALYRSYRHSHTHAAGRWLAAAFGVLMTVLLGPVLACLGTMVLYLLR